MPSFKICVCSSLEPFHLEYVESTSDPNIEYGVWITDPDDPPERLVCSCKGYKYAGHCKHQKIAYSQRCGWIGTDESIPYCPHCGKSTFEQTVWIKKPDND